jgi:acyl-CoA dehydrogenase
MAFEQPMHRVLNDQQRQLHDRVANFAMHVLAAHGDLHELDMPPAEMGKTIAANGLRGILVPRECGGAGGNYLDLAVAAGAMAHYGKNPGMAMSWLLNELIAGMMADKGVFPNQSKGVAALAVSEPGSGARRSQISTRAERRGDSFILSGEKTFVTNAPIADVFIVVAVTGSREGKSELSAFVVSADTPGLTRTKPLVLPFLRPCPHGGIVLENCVVASDALFGRLGQGYEETAVRIRSLEDVLAMALFAGTMSAQLDLIVASDSTAASDDTVCSELGRLRVLCDAAWCLAYSGAGMIDDSEVPAEALSLAIACRGLVEEFQAVLQKQLDTGSLKQEKTLYQLTADLSGMLSIAKYIAAFRQRKFGAALIKGAR